MERLEIVTFTVFHGLLCVIVTVPVIDNCAPQVHFSGGQPVAQAHEFRLS